MNILQQRLKSPPGKLVRVVAFALLESYMGPVQHEAPEFEAPLLKSKDIPFSTLELAAEVRAEAACADDAEVDLSTWSYQGETVREAAARMVLRRVAVK